MPPSDLLEVAIAGVCTEIADRPEPSESMRRDWRFADRWERGDLRFDAGYGYVMTIAGRDVLRENGRVPFGFPSDEVGVLAQPFRLSVLLAEICALYAFVRDVDLVGYHVRILTSSTRLVEIFTGRRLLPEDDHLARIIHAIARALGAKRIIKHNALYYSLRRRQGAAYDPRSLAPFSTEISYISEVANARALDMARAGAEPFPGEDGQEWAEKFFYSRFLTFSKLVT